MSLGRVFGSFVGLATITGTIFSGAALYMYAVDNNWFVGVPDLRVASKTVELAPPIPTAKAPSADADGKVDLRNSVFTKPKRAKRSKRRVASRSKTRAPSRNRTVSIFKVAKDIPHPNDQR